MHLKEATPQIPPKLLTNQGIKSRNSSTIFLVEEQKNSTKLNINWKKKGRNEVAASRAGVDGELSERIHTEGQDDLLSSPLTDKYHHDSLV